MQRLGFIWDENDGSPRRLIEAERMPLSVPCTRASPRLKRPEIRTENSSFAGLVVIIYINTSFCRHVVLLSPQVKLRGWSETVGHIQTTTVTQINQYNSHGSVALLRIGVTRWLFAALGTEEGPSPNPIGLEEAMPGFRTPVPEWPKDSFGPVKADRLCICRTLVLP